MANNRMYLHHIPTGKSFYLGKRMTDGWYYGGNTAEIGDNLIKFYEAIEGNYLESDNFIIAMEDNTLCPTAIEFDAYLPVREPFKVIDIDPIELTPIDKLKHYLIVHESDIILSVNDFGDLTDVFEWIIKRPPMSRGQ